MKQQVLYYLGFLLCVPLLPVLYLQARRVRATVPRLPEAEGDGGSIGDGAETFRLLTLGESTIAGVGVPHHRDGMTGQIARRVQERTGKRVLWKALGRSGHTARQVMLDLAPRIPTEPVDLVVIGLGGNDAFSLHSPLRWKSDLNGLVEATRAAQPRCPIVIANLPPVGNFPAFPPLMQRVLRGLVSLLDGAIHDLPARHAGVGYAAGPVRFDDWLNRCESNVTVDDFFSDGVHPSALTYELWSSDILDVAWPLLEAGAAHGAPRSDGERT